MEAFSISVAMERFPGKVSVALFFFKRTPPETVMDCQFSFEDGPVPTIASLGPNYMAHSMYQHCEQEVLGLAKMLVRPSGIFFKDWNKESLLTKERYGSIDRVYVICEEDRVMREEFQWWNIQNSPPQEVKFLQELTTWSYSPSL
ncbi:hypothetical protein RJ641_011298 [Dillenia turbinata]|uniref:Uncharacterized protein n=1 Tax=Dillenia turbinata TaxID=194707 RepID=A0AAN8Z1I9_9MAGN